MPLSALEATSRRFSVKYLLAVMNTSVARDFLRANRRSNIHLYPEDWKKLPIPDVSPAGQTKVVALVDRILVERKQDPNANIAVLEREIDRLVYELYGLTREEIAIVEGKSS
jgi:Type II restriction enzyme, methylase subunits